MLLQTVQTDRTPHNAASDLGLHWMVISIFDDELTKQKFEP